MSGLKLLNIKLLLFAALLCLFAGCSPQLWDRINKFTVQGPFIAVATARGKHGHSVSAASVSRLSFGYAEQKAMSKCEKKREKAGISQPCKVRYKHLF